MEFRTALIAEIDGTHADRGARQVEEATKRVDRAGDNMKSGLKRASKEGAQALSGMEKAAAGVRQELVRLAGIYVSIQGVRRIVEITDAYKSQTAQLALVTESERELERVRQSLLELSNETRSSQATSVELYAKITRATSELATTEAERLQIVQLINQAGVVSGATIQQQEAAIRQLAQGLEAGALRGDEFISVMENAPRVAQAIADGLGVAKGELRELATQGKLTAEVVSAAMLSQADVINTEFAKVPVTVGQAYQVLANELNNAIGGSESMAVAMQGFIGMLEFGADFIANFDFNIARFFGNVEKGWNTVRTASEIVWLAAGAKFDEYQASVLSGLLQIVQFMRTQIAGLDVFGVAGTQLEALTAAETALSVAIRENTREVEDQSAAIEVARQALKDENDAIDDVLSSYNGGLTPATEENTRSTEANTEAVRANAAAVREQVAAQGAQITRNAEGIEIFPIVESRLLGLNEILASTINEAASVPSVIGEWQNMWEGVMGLAEESAQRSQDAWFDFFTGILNHDGFGALSALFQTEFVAGGFDENGNPTAGLFGEGGQLSQGGQSAFGGASAALQLYEQGATTGQVALGAIGAAIGAYYGGAAGAQFGAAVGSFVGGIVDPAEEGSSEIRTTDAPFMTAPSDRRITTQFGDVWVRSGRDGFSNSQPQAVRQLRQFFNTIEGMFDDDQLSGVRLPSLTDLTTSDVASGQFLRPFLDSVVNNLDPVLRGLVGPIDDVAQGMERLAAAAALFESAFGTDAVADVIEETRRANLGLAASVAEIGAEATEAARGFTGTVASMRDVTTATEALHVAAADALRAIAVASENVSTLTDNTLDQLAFMRVGTDPAAQMRFLQNRANDLSAELLGAVTPQDVQRLVEQINAITMQAVQIDPSITNIDRASSFLTEIESNAQRQLENMQDAVVSAYDKALQEVRDSLSLSAQAHADASNVIGIGADRIWDAGSMIQKGGEDLLRAAQLMLDIPVDLGPVKPVPIAPAGPGATNVPGGPAGLAAMGLTPAFFSGFAIGLSGGITAGASPITSPLVGDTSALNPNRLGLNRGQLIEAVNRELEILAGGVDGLGNAAEQASFQIVGTINDLLGSMQDLRFSDLSPLTPAEQLVAAEGNFFGLAERALAGDFAAFQQLEAARLQLLEQQAGATTTASDVYADLFFETERLLGQAIERFADQIDPITGADRALQDLGTTIDNTAIPALERITAALGNLGLGGSSESDNSAQGFVKTLSPVGSNDTLIEIRDALNDIAAAQKKRDVPVGRQRREVAMVEK